MNGIHTQMATLVTSLADQRNSDSAAVTNRLAGVDTELTKVSTAVLELSTKFDQLMTVVTNMAAAPKGWGKGQGKDKGEAKTLIQLTDTSKDTAAASDDAGADEEPTIQSQTKAARKAGA